MTLTIDPSMKINNELKVGQRIMNDEKCLFPRSKAHELKAGQRVLHKPCIQAPQEGKSVFSLSKTCCCLVDLSAEKNKPNQILLHQV